MNEAQRHEHADLWDEIDCMVETRLVSTETLVFLMKEAIAMDPEGAARRAAASPQYDHDRARKADPELAAAHAEASVFLLGGTEHEPVPDGGGDSGKPHPSDFALAAPAALRDCE